MEELMKLAAIWLEKPVFVEDENGKVFNTVRIYKGMNIRWNNKWFEPITKDSPANATIEECWGDAFSTVLKMDIIKNDFKTHTIILKWEK